MKIEGYDWDNGNLAKLQKHGLGIDQIEDFLNSNPFVCADEKHNEVESRFIAFGEFNGCHLFVAFTIRSHGRALKVRVISARYAQKKELEKFYGKS